LKAGQGERGNLMVVIPSEQSESRDLLKSVIPTKETMTGKCHSRESGNPASSVVLQLLTCVAVQSIVCFFSFSNINRYSVRPGKLKKQADFACFNGLFMLLWDKSLDVCVFDN